MSSFGHRKMGVTCGRSIRQQRWLKLATIEIQTAAGAGWTTSLYKNLSIIIIIFC